MHDHSKGRKTAMTSTEMPNTLWEVCVMVEAVEDCVGAIPMLLEVWLLLSWMPDSDAVVVTAVVCKLVANSEL